MNKREITFRDPVVERVVDKFISRSDVGFKKYGTTLHEERTTKLKGLLKYLQDIQEELMDAVLYIQTAREEIEDNTFLESMRQTYPEFRKKHYEKKD